MKKIVIILASAALVGLAVLCVVQIQQLRKVRQAEAEAQQALRAETENRQAHAEKVQALESERVRLNQTVDQFTGLVHSLRGSMGSNRPGTAGKPGDPATAKEETGSKTMMGALAKMMKDPSMQEFLRDQQKTVLQTMYGPMLKEMNLTPEEKENFMNLAMGMQMAAIEQSSAMFQEGEAGKGDAAKALKEKEAEVEAGMKTLLGEERYGQYQEYKKTMADRMALDQFRQQLDGAPPLQDEQVKGLLQVMKEERESIPPVIQDKTSAGAASAAQQLSDENIERQLLWQSNLNQRVLQRAGQVLSQDQLKAYADYQARQLNMQKAGIKMAREFFGGSKTDVPEGNAAPTPAR